MSQIESHAMDSVQNPQEENKLPSNGISGSDTPPNLFDTDDHNVNKLQVSDGDFHTNASITDDGRVNIKIDQKSHFLTSQVVPALQRVLQPRIKHSKQPGDSLPDAINGVSDSSPPPPMNIVIHVVGSRGDVQPFVSLGKVLREKYNHRVRLATHATFKTFVEENGLEFFNIGGDPVELMAYMVKNPGLMPGVESLKSGDVARRRKGMYEIVKGCWRSCIESGNGMDEPSMLKNGSADSTNDKDSKGSLDRPFIADAIIANPPSFAHIHCAERLGIPLHLMFTMPWSPTQSFPHPLTTIHSSNAEPNMTNLVSYALVEMMTWQGLGDVMNHFRERVLGLEPVSRMWAPGMASRMRIPFTYCWSPALIPKPEDWGGHIYVSGFYFLSLASAYTPDPKLVAFLQDGPPPVYIGFGSIVVDDPDAMTKLVFDAVKKSGVRALVSKGWGGLGNDELSIPDNIFMLGNVPHDWLFKHVSAVVHHGGAGTTAAGILAGRPTVVVPFFGDQPFWGAMTARAGAGPEPVPYKHLTADSLSAAILKALAPAALQKAKELGERLSKEEGADAGAKSFHNMLNLNNHRCSVSSNRVAVWGLRNSDIKMSALAAIVLGDEGLLDISDLKLYRPYEYNSEDGPWDPITGGASALLGTISSLMVGIADVPVELIQGLKSTVQKNAAEHAKANSIMESKAQQNSANESTAKSESSKPADTNVNLSSTVEAISPVQPDDNPKVEVNEVTPSQLSDANRTHTIDVASVPHPKHTHTIRSDDTFEHKAAVKTEKGASRVAMEVLRPPMDFTLSVARGFHNAPKLYGDDTVRLPDKITDFQTGIKAAGKELGYGIYDGISGLVTQPFNGAKKHGFQGFLLGVGRGLGGLLLKPGAGLFGLGGYTFKGIFRELQKHTGATQESYIVAARITQGNLDWNVSTAPERLEIVQNFRKLKDEEQKLKDETHHDHAGPLRILHRDQKNSQNNLSSSDSEPAPTQTGSGETAQQHLEHKHSFKSHLPHLHRHEDRGLLNGKKQFIHSTTELPLEKDGIPEANSSPVRHVMSL